MKFRSMNYESFKIRGSPTFKEKSIDALKWIKTKSPKDYSKIKRYLKGIKQSNHSYMGLKDGIFRVSKTSAYHSVEWYAGIIIHDVHHYYLHNIEQFKWISKNFKKHEHLCFDEQLKFLKKIKAPLWIIKHVEGAYNRGHWQVAKRKKQRY